MNQYKQAPELEENAAYEVKVKVKIEVHLVNIGVSIVPCNLIPSTKIITLLFATDEIVENPYLYIQKRKNFLPLLETGVV